MKKEKVIKMKWRKKKEKVQAIFNLPELSARKENNLFLSSTCVGYLMPKPSL